MSDKFRKTYRGYLVDHHSPEPPVISFEKLNADEWEKFILEANLDHLMLYCKDHWGNSYYNTAVGRLHPALEGRDFVSEIAPILKKHNVEFTAYYCFEYDSYAPKAHPEWSHINRDNVPLICGMPTNSSNAKWGMPCYETGYRQYILGQLKEIVTNYHPDSLFIDIFGKSMCYCPTCLKRFKDRYGYDEPRDDAGIMEKNADLVEFLDESAARMLKDVKALVKGIDPELAVTINFAAHYPKFIRDELDYMYTEPWAGNWLSGAYAVGTSGGKPVQLGPGSVSKVFNYQNTPVYLLATGEIAAQGCHVFLYSESLRADGALEPEEAKRIGEAYREVEKYEKWLLNRTAHADVAIVQSDLADTLRVDQPIPMRSISRALVSGLHRKALKGAMELCDYAKRTWCVVPDTELDYKRMKQYKLLLLANVFHISDDMKADLKRYISEGGCVLFAGENGVLDHKGAALSDFTAADLMGCHFVEKDETYLKNKWCGYIAQKASPVWNGCAETTPPVAFYQLKVKNDGAEELGGFIDPACLLTDTTWINWGNPQPGKENGCPAILKHQVGNGCVYTVCFDMCTMGLADYPWLKPFIRSLMQDAFSPTVELVTPYLNTLEYSAYTMDADGSLLVHELNASPRLNGGDVIPMSGGKLAVDPAFGKVTAAEQVYPVQRSLETDTDPETGIQYVQLPVVDIHNIYRISR